MHGYAESPNKKSLQKNPLSPFWYNADFFNNLESWIDPASPTKNVKKSFIMVAHSLH
jgi:hypothetical protein